MSDTNKYVNIYIETVSEYAHEYFNSMMQLKTQLRVATDLIKEKDEVVAALNEKLEIEKGKEQEANKALSDAKAWEEQYNSMKGRTSNYDVLTDQYNELKKVLVSKNEEIQRISSELETTKKNVSEKQEQITTLEKEVKELNKKIPASVVQPQTPAKVIERKSTSPKKINTKSNPVLSPVVDKPKEELTEETDDF